MRHELESRQQRARQAFWDELMAPQPGRIASPEDTQVALESAIETATRVRITPEIEDAAQNAFPVFTSGDEARFMLTAAFRAAGFEVEE